MTEFLGAQRGWATHKCIFKKKSISHYQIGSANKPEPCRNSVTFNIKNTAEQINFRSWVPSAGSFVNPDVRTQRGLRGGRVALHSTSNGTLWANKSFMQIVENGSAQRTSKVNNDRRVFIRCQYYTWIKSHKSLLYWRYELINSALLRLTVE